MYANSRFIISNQAGIHDDLSTLVSRHAATEFLKPIASYNAAAFTSSIHAWRTAGYPPLILDAGCGTGVSTINLACQFPDHFVIGVDQSADRLARSTDKQQILPGNFVTVRADLVDYWRLLRQQHIRLHRHYLLYPNPWPKKRHIARRWHGHAIFPTIVALGGYLECRSNWQIYIDECAAALSQLTGLHIETGAYAPAAAATPSGYLTPFEQKYAASGHSLWRCYVNLPSVDK